MQCYTVLPSPGQIIRARIIEILRFKLGNELLQCECTNELRNCGEDIEIPNREMVDCANLIICYIEHEKGSAWQKVQYAMEQVKTVIMLTNKDKTVNLLLQSHQNHCECDGFVVL